jgi:hypothetical protein
MMRTSFLVLILAGCGTSGVDRGAVENKAQPPPEAAPAPVVQTDSLTGLYESGQGPRRSQMCLVDGSGGASRFGLVLWGAGEASCSGAGTAARTGDVVRFTMEGDQACVVEGRVDGTRLAFPSSLPEGCAYYCGQGASLARATFVKVGGTSEDAGRARDLVGDPLCG